MKILMINKFLYPNGGSENYVFKLGNQLKKCGHQVQYFGMDDERNIVGNNIGAYTRHMDFHKASIAEKLSYPFQVIYSKSAREKLRKILDDFSPDVCHLNNFNYQLTPSIILEIVTWRKLTEKKCKIVYTAHDGQLVCPNHMMRNPVKHENCLKCVKTGSLHHCLTERCLHGSLIHSLLGSIEGIYWRHRQVYKYLDTIICPSYFMQKILNHNPLFSDKTVVLHNFVDEDEEKFDVKKKNYVLYFGRYSEEKGIDLLLAACRQLPDIQFIFAGKGPLLARVRKEKNIKEVGFQTKDALKKLISEARFSVYPSVWFENCPFSVIESQMYGTPVLGADIGGIKELIDIRKTGDVFIAGSLHSLKNKIRELWDHEDILTEYTANCQKYESMGINAYVNQVIYIYRGYGI